ncbi:hypothetical protein KY348_07240 [Candidatus Woesearchaeota archaeon]|nr:hypothetical protein [Candidatus Woesearchaeota archaeon]
MKEVIEKAMEWALKEIKTNDTPSIVHFHLGNSKGQELAEKLNADKDIIMLGTILMDVKLGECFKEGKLEEHIDRSAQATKKFLEKFDINEEKKKKIINCVEAHHGGKFICKEAEICANADCYRFLHPLGIFAYFELIGKRFNDISKSLELAEKKLEEKHKILTLDICKKELEPYYRTFKELFEKARSEK